MERKRISSSPNLTSAAALALVDSMYENQKNADAFSKMAYNRFDQLKAESKTQMDDFIRQIFVQ